MKNVQKIGDELLTEFVNKEYNKVQELWSEFTIRHNESFELVKELHCYKNPKITDAAVSTAVVTSVNTLRQALEAWKGKKLRRTEACSVVDGVDFITITDTWENHTETTTRPFGESEYLQHHYDGIITQSELHAILESLKKREKVINY